MSLSFNELGLSEKALDAVERLGYQDPTPVQSKAIPKVLGHQDIIAAAKTGTGKTAAFALPSMDTLGHIQRGQGPSMLIVTPTRELAQQIGKVCETIAKSTHHRILTVVGGMSYDPQKRGLKKGVDVLIATPGRLIDLMEQKAVKLNNVNVLVLDEADRMLDMGFWPAMKRIIAATPKTRQTLLFSATIDDKITKSVGDILKDPAYIEIAHKGETADTVDQFIIPATQPTKPMLLKATLEEKGGGRVIVFTRTRSRADSCTRRLRRAGFAAEAIHSDRSQAQRKRALENFAKGKVDILVATDVLARGIDVPEVNYVINYDLPNQPEDYIHRIGRTGRAGEKGYSISFVSPDQKSWLKDIERLIKKKIPVMELNSFDLRSAEKEAAQKSNDSHSSKDPELAKAAAEYSKRTKKKKRDHSQGTPNDRESKYSSVESNDSSTNSNNKYSNSSKKPKAMQPRRNPKKSSRQSEGTYNPNAKTKATISPKKSKPSSKANSSKVTQKGSSKPDMRPGRAHRATLASHK